MIPDAPGVSVGDLPLQQPPFAVHFDHIQPHDPVDEFHGVIGQDGELIRKDDYVELSSHRYEVCTKVVSVADRKFKFAVDYS